MNKWDLGIPDRWMRLLSFSAKRVWVCLLCWENMVNCGIAADLTIFAVCTVGEFVHTLHARLCSCSKVFVDQEGLRNSLEVVSWTYCLEVIWTYRRRNLHILQILYLINLLSLFHRFDWLLSARSPRNAGILPTPHKRHVNILRNISTFTWLECWSRLAFKSAFLYQL